MLDAQIFFEYLKKELGITRWVSEIYHFWKSLPAVRKILGGDFFFTNSNLTNSSFQRQIFYEEINLSVFSHTKIYKFSYSSKSPKITATLATKNALNLGENR